MAIKSDYISGTLSITQGSANFTGVGTGWRSAEFKEGDTIIDITGATEYMGVIESITGEGSGILTKPWEGPTLINVAYRLRYQPDGSRSTAQARNLVEILGNGNITAFALLNGAANLLPIFTGPGAMSVITKQELVSGANYDIQVPNLAGRAAYDGQDQGYAVLVSDIGNGRAAIYSKVTATSGDWSDPAFVTGEVGPMVQIQAGTTTTLPTGQNATLDVRTIPVGYALDFGIPRGIKGDPGTQGPVGEKGDGLYINQVGPLSERDLYDNEPEAFTFVDSDTGNLYFRVGDTPGVWSDPIPFGKGEKGDPGINGADIVTTNGVGNGTAGPYVLNSIPISDSATWASVSGIDQYDFTLNGNEITFGIIVLEDVPWQVKSSGVLSVVEPADGSVGANKIKSSEASAIRDTLNVSVKPTTATNGNLAVFNTNREVVDLGISKATTVQAQAGTNDIVYMTPLKTAQAIAVLSPPTDVSSLYSSVSSLALALSDLQGARFFMNGGVADSFDDQTGVSLGPEPSYSNLGGRGDRNSIISITTNLTFQIGVASNLINGTKTSDLFFNDAQSSSGKYLRFDFGTQKIITEATWFQPTNQSHGVWKWQGSNNASSWTDIGGSFTLGGVLENIHTSLHENINGYRYYQLLGISGATSSGPYLHEIEFRIDSFNTGSSSNYFYDALLDLYKPILGTNLTSTHTSDTQDGNTITSSSFAPGFPAWKVVDKVVGQSTSNIGNWLTSNSQTTGWLNYQFAVAKTIFSYGVRPPNNVTDSIRAPRDWTLQGSNTGAFTGEQTILDTRANQTFPDLNSVRVFDIQSPSSFSHYRLVITANNGGTDYLQMDEWYLYSNYSNMTLISVPYPATAIPTQGRLVLQIDSPNSLISGTDFDGAISRDGGTTWISTPLSLTVSAGSLKTYETTSLINFTGPTGSSLRFRIRTLTNKNIPVSGVVMQWK